MNRNFGSEPEGGFNEFTAAYKNDPTIENYLEMRRHDPDAEIEVAVIGGFEQLCFMDDELQKHGFDTSTVASIMDADEHAISLICLQILENICEARRLQSIGETQISSRGLTVPDKLIDWLIMVMLDSLSWNDDLQIPRDLIVLIRERLGGSNPQYEQASRANEMRNHAVYIGGQLLAKGKRPSFRMLANFFGVAPSTVKRWFEGRDFDKEVEQCSSFFNADGSPRSAKELGMALRGK